jgi:hypothetical protein
MVSDCASGCDWLDAAVEINRHMPVRYAMIFMICVFEGINKIPCYCLTVMAIPIQQYSVLPYMVSDPENTVEKVSILCG